RVKIKTVTFTAEKVNFFTGRRKTIKHKLKTREVTITVTAPDGRKIKGKTEGIDENRARFMAEEDIRGATVTVVGKRKRRVIKPDVVVNTFVRILTGFKTASLNYTETNGTILPGYTSGTDLFGLNFGGPSVGPDFVFGRQFSELDLVNGVVKKE